MHLQDKSQARVVQFAVFVAISLILIIADYHKTIPSARTALSIAVYPLKFLVDLPYTTAQNTKLFFTSHAELSTQNKELRSLVTVYSARDQKYRSIAAENKRLREALKVTEKTDEPFLLSNILTIDTDRFHQTVNIDKGTNEGAYEGQIALAGNSIFGQIIESSPYSSIVMQLSDPKHSIPVRNVRTGENALAVGTGQTNVVQLEHVLNLEDVKTGDLYTSSGLGLLFPPDFPVAVVQEKHYNPSDSTTTITATTVTDFNRARELLLIWQSNPTTPTDEN